VDRNLCELSTSYHHTAVPEVFEVHSESRSGSNQQQPFYETAPRELAATSPTIPKKDLFPQSPSIYHRGERPSPSVIPNSGANFELESSEPSDEEEARLQILRARLENVREDKERLEKIQELKDLEENLNEEIMLIQRGSGGK
jgi:hypothetical protein